MKKLFKEISIITLIAIMLISLVQFPVNATNDENEEIEIIRTDNEYLVYVLANVHNKFQFAFANESTVEISTLNFINSITDSEGNNIAYVDSALEEQYFTDADSENGKNVYMWIKQGEQVSEPILVDLSSVITQDVVDFVSGTIVDGNRVNGITTRIPIIIGQEEKEPVTEGNTTVTTTVGYLQIQPQDGYTYEYQLIELPNTNYTRFVELAEEISKFTESNNSYENISKINEFYNLYNSLVPESSSEDWKEVINNRVEQPENARNGDKYIVWIKAINSNGDEIVDVQIMTSVRKESEKTITETLTEEVTTTTKLPVTFDSNIILIIVLGVIIVAIIVLLIVKKKLSKNK